MNVRGLTVTQRLKLDRKVAVVLFDELEKELFRIRVRRKAAVVASVVRLVEEIGTLHVFLGPFLRARVCR